MCGAPVLDDYRQCYDHSPFAFCIVQVTHNSAGEASGLRFCYVNDACAAMLGCARDPLSGASPCAFLSDARCLQACDEAVRTGEIRSFQTTYSSRNLCVQCGRVATDLCGCQWMDVSFLGHTELEATVRQLREEKDKFGVALSNSDLMVWEYDIGSHTSMQQQRCMSRFALPYRMENVPESLIESGLIHPDSAEDYRALYRHVISGSPFSQADIRMVLPNCETLWFRLRLQTVFDASGHPVSAMGCGMDITELKLAQLQFEQEMRSLQSAADNTLLGKCRANLSRDRIDHYVGGDNLLIDRQAITYTQVVQSISELCVGPLTPKQLAQSLLPEAALQRLAQGESRFEAEYQRRMRDQSIHWVKTMQRVYTDPNTGDALCYLYTYDMNQQKMTQFAFDMVVRQTYDFVGVISCLTGGYTSLVRVKGRAYLPPQRHESYEAVTLEYASRLREHFDTPVDYDLACHVASIENLNGELQKHGRLDVTLKIWNEARSVLSNYRFSFAYLDAKQTQILVCRADITATVSEEQRQQLLLRSALTQAQQASVAKTEFLSRMSHEIRTPMNAIIGMSALAAQCVNDPKQVADCISKVGISARFLLSLINDILDMSRIESGKINIKSEKIPFEEFIGGINAICYEQATQKGVDYDAIVATFTEDYYMGDAMKLQQVLVNIIANAVKFTPKGGKVQLIVQQEREADGKAYMKFIVNDTGIGIHEEFLPKLFEPFEQENQGVSSLYGGTGLGLAICKNLIELMGGRITVNSIAGVGSEFTVEVTLGLCEDKSARTACLTSIPLDQLSALVVDDDILICENTRAILLDMGLKAEWADSGRKAMEQVRRRFAENKNYDIVLIDWKMPEMDGIETARQIRTIVGPDVTIIIITAYDWASIEAEARAAGVNMLMSKPLFKTSLMSAFRRIYSGRKQNVAPEPVEYDFSGRHALLVEDHLLNVEVARRLLMAKHMEVEVAENGLAALEAFAAAPLGHFDVILMDIRMPVMDGLTAARSIRQMKKKTAQNIPIIAMSANAFDEDVEKSRLAGMTAHLAKPIEPEVLYATLQQHLPSREEANGLPDESTQQD